MKDHANHGDSTTFSRVNLAGADELITLLSRIAADERASQRDNDLIEHQETSMRLNAAVIDQGTIL